mgnify:CR=1 FL=1
MNKLRQMSIIFLLAGVVISQSGCFALLVGAAAGAGIVAWINGDLEYNFDAPLNKVHRAVLRGLKKLDLAVTQDQKDKHNAKIKSAYSDGKDVNISINAITERSSKIKIRVGVFGDQARSEAILSAIQSYL